MGIIKAKQLVHEYIRRDEEGNVESIQTALDHIDLDVQPGQFIAILGHNGSGKSTLAKHINALLAPTEGSLWIDGKDVTQEENILPVRKTAGMVFQNPDTCVRIPMIGETRSLNLSNSVAIVLYEALRQNHFDHMKLEGQLHRLKWED